MKRSVLFGVFVAGVVMFCFATNASAYTFLDHLMSVNGVICKEKKCVAAGETAEKCEARLNAISAKNPQNKALEVSSAKSGACISELMGDSVNCQNIMGKSIEGKCAINSLK